MCEILVFEYYELYGALGFPMDLSLELGVYKLGDDAEDRNPSIIVLQNARRSRWMNQGAQHVA